VLRPETTAADIAGWDSPMHLDIIAAVEARFGIKIQSREIERLGNVGDFVQLILAKAIPMKYQPRTVAGFQPGEFKMESLIQLNIENIHKMLRQPAQEFDRILFDPNYDCNVHCVYSQYSLKICY